MTQKLRIQFDNTVIVLHINSKTITSTYISDQLMNYGKVVLHDVYNACHVIYVPSNIIHMSILIKNNLIKEL